MGRGVFTALQVRRYSPVNGDVLQQERFTCAQELRAFAHYALGCGCHQTNSISSPRYAFTHSRGCRLTDTEGKNA